MPSPEALRLEDVLRAAPTMIEMDLEHQREAGEHAEDLTLDPAGVTYESRAAVDLTVTLDGLKRMAGQYLNGTDARRSPRPSTRTSPACRRC